VAKSKFGYEEPKAALNARIEAHAKYSDFNLHEWMKVRFQLRTGENILDLGCGNGNYTRLFWDFVGPSGRVIGTDKSANLIDEAKKRHADLPHDRVQFLVQDFDEPFPDFGVSFDWIFAIYSLYYASDALRVVKKVRSLMTPGGTFVVIGPGPENVKDLTEFNTMLTGREPDAEHSGRIQRIAKEFQPLFRTVFSGGEISYEEVDSTMEFPDAASYCEYYWSTLLWRQSVEGLSEAELERLKHKVMTSVSPPIQVRKQMSCLTGGGGNGED
jgi:ubiquinone/menaquinone biosynthesis C-methylase UbiE